LASGLHMIAPKLRQNDEVIRSGFGSAELIVDEWVWGTLAGPESNRR